MSDVQSKNSHYKSMPKRVKIGSLWFGVDVEEMGDAEAMGTFGHMNPVNQRIRVRPGLTPQMLTSVFIHESLHAMYFDSYLFVPNDKPEEETIVRHTTAGLCRIWQDNPEVMRWWAKYNAAEAI